LYELRELRGWERDPLMYNQLVGNAIFMLISRDFAPWEQRLANVYRRLLLLPRLLEQAKANLNNPPKIHLETAIKQNKGTINLIKNDLAKVLDKAPALKDSLLAASDKAVVALQAYGTFLEQDLLPRAQGDFRLGEEKYRKKLAYTLESELSSEEILQRAEDEYAWVRKEMYETAAPIHEKLFPDHRHAERGDTLINAMVKEVLAEIAKDHPRGEDLLDVCRRELRAIEDFVREKDLIGLPTEPLAIEWAPEFRRGVAVAELDAPGPLEKGQKSFYFISTSFHPFPTTGHQNRPSPSFGSTTAP